MSDDREPVQRIIDMRIPLPWLITGVVSIAFSIITMWFQVQQLTAQVSEMNALIKQGNTQVATIVADLALTRFRVEKNEADIRDLKRLTQKGQPDATH